MTALRLGGNIELINADNLDRGAIVVVKKLVGNYARKFSDKGLDRLAVTFQPGSVLVEANVQGRSIITESQHQNVFFSMDRALRDVERQL